MGSKIERKYQKIFSNTGPTGIVGQFGSYKAGSPVYSLDVATICALDKWNEGINGSSINSAPPAIQDMNSLFYVITRWLYYHFEVGIPEWQTTSISREFSSYVSYKDNGVTGIYLSATANPNNDPVLLEGTHINSRPNQWQLIFKQKSFDACPGSASDWYVNASHSFSIVQTYTSPTTGIIYLPDIYESMNGKHFTVFIDNTSIHTTSNFTFKTMNTTGIIDGSTTKSLSVAGDSYALKNFVCDGSAYHSYCTPV